MEKGMKVYCEKFLERQERFEEKNIDKENTDFFSEKLEEINTNWGRFKGINFKRYESERQVTLFHKAIHVIEFPYYEALYSAVKSESYADIPKIIYQHTRHNVLYWMGVNTGVDHSHNHKTVLETLSVADFEMLEKCLPLDCGLAVSGYWYDNLSANLIMAIYYKDSLHIEYCEENIPTFLQRKMSLYEKAYLQCLVGIFRKDADMINDNLEAMCKALQRTRELDIDKALCLSAHGLYNLARWNMPDEQDKILMPKHSAFWKEAFLGTDEPPREMYYEYKGELSFMNEMYKNVPTIRIHTAPTVLSLSGKSAPQVDDVDFAEQVSKQIVQRLFK